MDLIPHHLGTLQNRTGLKLKNLLTSRTDINKLIVTIWMQHIAIDHSRHIGSHTAEFRFTLGQSNFCLLPIGDIHHDTNGLNHFP